MMCHAQQPDAKIRRTINIIVTRRQLLVDEDEKRLRGICKRSVVRGDVRLAFVL
jgi:hypothetical protein